MPAVAGAVPVLPVAATVVLSDTGMVIVFPHVAHGPVVPANWSSTSV
jgi:hypothetical protein